MFFRVGNHFCRYYPKISAGCMSLHLRSLFIFCIYKSFSWSHIVLLIFCWWQRSHELLSGKRTRKTDSKTIYLDSLHPTQPHPLCQSAVNFWCQEIWHAPCVNTWSIFTNLRCDLNLHPVSLGAILTWTISCHWQLNQLDNETKSSHGGVNFLVRGIPSVYEFKYHRRLFLIFRFNTK